jgi:hypothetical protein
MPVHQLEPQQDLSKLHNKLLKINSNSCSSLHSLSLTTTNESYDPTTPVPETEDCAMLDPYSDLYISNHITPKTTSILSPGSIFIGTQQSGRSTYEVRVELKYVDLNSSFLCGYIHIEGLTESYPQLTTYFEAEMVGRKHGFYTTERAWGASDDIDIQHWSKFSHWREALPVKKILDKSYVHKDPFSHTHLYMRWKEQFLVPDAKAQELEGASFAGFYYICLNQITGDINGLYYHKSSERFQQLELCHIPTRGVRQTYQFL